MPLFYFRSAIPRLAGLLALLGISAVIPSTGFGWGYDGHARVGRVALAGLDPTAKLAVMEILGSDRPEALDEACSWPDVVRRTPKWEWSAPQHYVNIPRAADTYRKERDCADGMCVTEAIKKYANQLSTNGLNERQDWEALAWVCHLVGDLHQPLHVGYKDDRGGNQVEIVFNGEPEELHEFWDQSLIEDRIGSLAKWPDPSAADAWLSAVNRWNPAETDDWTTESRRLMKQYAYPAQPVIQSEFADRSWELIQQQVQKAGERLAAVLNAAIGEGEIDLERGAAEGVEEGQ
jgi:hypothetical protein